MERTIYKLIGFSCIFILLNISVSANKTEIYNAYIKGDIAKWKNIIDRIQESKPTDNDMLLQLVNFQYGYIAFNMGTEKYNEAEKYLTLAEKNIDILMERKTKLSYVYSYKAAFYGFRIGLNMMKAPFLGPKSMEFAQKALQLDPRNPFAYIENGNIQFYMPEMLGGSKKLALDYYLKALQIMETRQYYLINNWNYLNLLIVIAQTYEKNNNLLKAKACYEKILRIEPGFLWVKNELYKKIINKINNNKK